MNFLVIGSGAREHIIAQRLVDSGVSVYSVITNRNPGLIELSKDFLFIQNYRNNLKEIVCLLYTSPSPRDKRQSRMPSSA